MSPFIVYCLILLVFVILPAGVGSLVYGLSFWGGVGWCALGAALGVCASLLPWRHWSRAFLMWWSGRLRVRLIQETQPDGTNVPYLERYFVARIFGTRVYLHRFVGSDPHTRGLHDHPWKWAWSFILWGFYYEQRRTGVTRVSWFNRLQGDTFHRVILPRDHVMAAYGKEVFTRREAVRLLNKFPTECWSLFLHRDAGDKPWGFWQEGNIDAGTQDPSLDGVRIKLVGVSAVYTPFVYPGDAQRSGEWWLKAPTGKELRANSARADEARNAL